MGSDHVVQAWKDLDFREAAGMPAHPAGEIELDTDPMVGGSTWPCVISATYLASCSDCDSTVNVGTCGAFSYGCCP